MHVGVLEHCLEVPEDLVRKDKVEASLQQHIQCVKNKSPHRVGAQELRHFKFVSSLTKQAKTEVMCVRMIFYKAWMEVVVPLLEGKFNECRLMLGVEPKESS